MGDYSLICLQVSRVTRNMASNKPVAITAKKVEENINTLCPQVCGFCFKLLNKVTHFWALDRERTGLQPSVYIAYV